MKNQLRQLCNLSETMWFHCLRAACFHSSTDYLGLWLVVITSLMMSLHCECCMFVEHYNCTTGPFQGLCISGCWRHVHLRKWLVRWCSGDCVTGGAAEPVVFVSPAALTSFLWGNPMFWQGGAGGAAVCVFLGGAAPLDLFFFSFPV